MVYRIMGLCLNDFAIAEYSLPSALEEWDSLLLRMRNKKVVIFLDYDGTLAPLCAKPELAVLSSHRKQKLEKLSQFYTTVIASGRLLEEQRNILPIESLYYLGNEGYESNIPLFCSPFLHCGKNFIAEINRAYIELLGSLSGIKGILIENKMYSLSVNFTLVENGQVKQVENIIDDIVESNPLLKKSYAKKVFEIRPSVDWNKGKAVESCIQALNLDKNNLFTLYIGDDVTDEPAFKVVRKNGVGILVSKYYRPTFGSYCLKSIHEAWKLVDKLIEKAYYTT